MGSSLNSPDAGLPLVPFALGEGNARALWTGGPLLGDFSFALPDDFGEAACRPRRPHPQARSAAAQRQAPPRPCPVEGSPCGRSCPGSLSLSGRAGVPARRAALGKRWGFLTVGAFVLERNF